MYVSANIQTTIVFQLVALASCQYPIQFPFPQVPHTGPISQIPPLPPQSFLPQQLPLHYPMPQKMPSVVMPFYSKTADKGGKEYRKKRRRMVKYHDSMDTDMDYSESSDYDFRRSNNRRQVLTPVVSYVTKDGYVVYQKKIKKDKAKDWLEMAKRRESQELVDSYEERKLHKMMKYKKSRRD